MEITLILILLLFTGILAASLWKNHCLKRDIYDFTLQLNESLDDLMKDKELPPAAYRQDDLWGMVYEKLCRISRKYTRKSQEIYEEKENLKELVSDLSHQTKTPLANIKLYLEMLSEETALAEHPHDETVLAEYLRKINGQVEKLAFLLQSMVKMSRLETGTIKIQKMVHPMTNTLAAAIEAILPQAEQKQILLHVSCEETLLLNHDKKWTGEAIFNILDNAVKYTKPGGSIYISVTMETIFTKISIADTGKGIPMERQGAVFGRFYREPEIHDNEGIGIGLYLAREIISMQNGYIRVESEVGKGSVFHIYLPN